MDLADLVLAKPELLKAFEDKPETLLELLNAPVVPKEQKPITGPVADIIAKMEEKGVITAEEADLLRGKGALLLSLAQEHLSKDITTEDLKALPLAVEVKRTERWWLKIQQAIQNRVLQGEFASPDAIKAAIGEM